MFTPEEIKMLAQAERDMDSGKRKFVINNNQRCLITDECLEALGLEAGQTINDAIFMAMLEFNIKMCQSKLSDQVLEQSVFDEEDLPELTPEDKQWCKDLTQKNFKAFWEQKQGKDSLENEIIADGSEHSVFEN